MPARRRRPRVDRVALGGAERPALRGLGTDASVSPWSACRSSAARSGAGCQRPAAIPRPRSPRPRPEHRHRRAPRRARAGRWSRGRTLPIAPCRRRPRCPRRRSRRRRASSAPHRPNGESRRPCEAPAPPRRARRRPAEPDRRRTPTPRRGDLRAPRRGTGRRSSIAPISPMPKAPAAGLAGGAGLLRDPFQSEARFWPRRSSRAQPAPETAPASAPPTIRRGRPDEGMASPQSRYRAWRSRSMKVPGPGRVESSRIAPDGAAGATSAASMDSSPRAARHRWRLCIAQDIDVTDPVATGTPAAGYRPCPRATHSCFHAARTRRRAGAAVERPRLATPPPSP